VVRHAKYFVFQRAEVAVPRQLFAAMLERIDRLRLAVPRDEAGGDGQNGLPVVAVRFGCAVREKFGG
jgi:hypothetical protein